MTRSKYELTGWATIVLFAALSIADWQLPDGDLLWLRFAGVFGLALAVVFIFLPFVHLKKYGESGNRKNYMETTVVADRGLYAIVRHPQYLGYVLLFAGFALLSQHWVTYLIAAGGIAVLYIQAVAEEHFCQEKFGVAYERYMARVPRFNLILGLWRIIKRGGLQA